MRYVIVVGFVSLFLILVVVATANPLREKLESTLQVEEIRFEIAKEIYTRNDFFRVQKVHPTQMDKDELARQAFDYADGFIEYARKHPVTK